MIGQNNQAGKSLLKTDYKEDAALAANAKLAVKIMLKTMDSNTPSPERIEISELKRLEDGSMAQVFVTDDEIKLLIEECQKEQEAESKSSGDI